MTHVLLLLATLLPALFVVGLLLLQRRLFRPVATPPSAPVSAPVRIADLRVEPAHPERNWRLALLATLLPLAATATLLALRWRSIPARFPIHWGLDGQPNGWAHRSPGSAFGLLVFAAVLVLAMGLLGELAAHSSPGHQGRSTILHTTRSTLIAVAWFLTLMCCAISLLPLARNATAMVPLLVAGVVIFSLAVIASIGYRATRIAPAISAAGRSTDPRFWKAAGLLYINPGDSALMVPKRDGLGYTLNFGRPVAWIIFGAILLLPLLLPLLLHSSRR